MHAPTFIISVAEQVERAGRSGAPLLASYSADRPAGVGQYGAFGVAEELRNLRVRERDNERPLCAKLQNVRI